MDIKERLTQKFGPLPVWGWGAIAGIVALIAYYLIYSRSGGGSKRAGATTTGTSLDPQGYQTAGITGGSASKQDDYVTPPNNMTWLSKTAKLVADHLGASPTEVYAALKKWLQGSALTVKEKAWIDSAITFGGSPPEGTQGISDVILPDDAIKNPVLTPPAPTTPTKPAPTAPANVDRRPAARYKLVNTDQIWQVNMDGTIHHMSLAEWVAAGQPMWDGPITQAQIDERYKV